MSDKPGQIREALQHITGTYKPGRLLFVAEITEVADADCSIKLGDTTLTKVKFFSIAEAGNLLYKPIVGSMALVADLSSGQLRDLIIVSVDKVELIRYEENGVVIEIDSQSKKLDIKNDQIGLKDLFQAVADIVKQLTVSTPSGPSGTPLPPTVQAVTQFETNFKKLLK